MILFVNLQMCRRKTASRKRMRPLGFPGHGGAVAFCDEVRNSLFVLLAVNVNGDYCPLLVGRGGGTDELQADAPRDGRACLGGRGQRGGVQAAGAGGEGPHQGQGGGRVLALLLAQQAVHLYQLQGTLNSPVPPQYCPRCVTVIRTRWPRCLIFLITAAITS